MTFVLVDPVRNISIVMVSSNNRIHVAVALILLENRLLIAKRHTDVHQGGKWEFPGGKVEAGETVFQALQRECLEELGLFKNTTVGSKYLSCRRSNMIFVPYKDENTGAFHQSSNHKQGKYN